MVASTITSQDFADQNIGMAVDACVSLHRAGKPLRDIALLSPALLSLGVPESVSGKLQLLKTIQGIPHVGHIRYYADRVRDLSRLRSMHVAAESFQSRVLETGAKPEDVLEWLEAKLLTLRHGAANEAKPVAEVWSEIVDDLQKRVGEPEPIALMSGLPAADNLGFVFAPGELTILAARTSVGKTSLATQIGMHHARKGRAVLFASLEMRDKDVGSRLLSPAAGYNHQWVRTAPISQECVEEHRKAMEQLGEPPFFLWSPGRVKVGMIHAAASLLKASSDLRMLIVDYIGLVRADDQRQDRRDQLGEIAKGLRDIAQQLQIPVLCLSQLNREAERERPRLSNLRESGAIEEDADIVAFLHPDSKDSTRVELIVAKNRQGGRGEVVLTWHKEQTRFDDETGGRAWTPDTSGHRESEDDFNQRQREFAP